MHKMRTDNTKTNQYWVCGYCGEIFYPMNVAEFLKHTEWCEIDCCNRNHGDLSGDC
jgi:hypothetical protein